MIWHPGLLDIKRLRRSVLVAQAPELLEHCKKLLAFVEENCPNRQVNDSGLDLTQIERDIAKAEGSEYECLSKKKTVSS